MPAFLSFPLEPMQRGYILLRAKSTSLWFCLCFPAIFLLFGIVEMCSISQTFAYQGSSSSCKVLFVGPFVMQLDWRYFVLWFATSLGKGKVWSLIAAPARTRAASFWRMGAPGGSGAWPRVAAVPSAVSRAWAVSFAVGVVWKLATASVSAVSALKIQTKRWGTSRSGPSCGGRISWILSSNVYGHIFAPIFFIFRNSKRNFFPNGKNSPPFG